MLTDRIFFIIEEVIVEGPGNLLFRLLLRCFTSSGVILVFRDSESSRLFSVTGVIYFGVVRREWFVSAHLVTLLC